MLGFHNFYMIQQMLNDVDFHLFMICLYNIKILIASIPNNNNYKGFAFSFMHKYKQKQSVIWKRLKGDHFQLVFFKMVKW